MKKRILSLVLALVMTLSLLPATVWATQDTAQTAQADAAAETVTGDVPLTEEKEETTSQEKTAQEEGQDEPQQTPDDADIDSSTPLLKELRLASGGTWEKSTHFLELTAEKIASGEKAFSASAEDTYSTVYAWASAAEGYSVTVDGNEVNAGSGTQIVSRMDGPETQTLTVEVKAQDDTVAETYTVTLTKKLTLSALSLKVGNTEIAMEPGFSRRTYDYEASVEAGTERITLDVQGYQSDYTILLNGDPMTSSTVTLDPAVAKETFVLSARSEDENAKEAKPETYTIKVKKKAIVPVAVTVQPAGALVFLYDGKNERVWPNEQGKFPLMEGANYTCVVTLAGYVGKTFTITTEKTVWEITLAKAEESVHGQNVTSSWPSFRGNKENNGMVAAKTPTQRDKAVLSWATKLGDGTSSRALSDPILITQDGVDYLVVYQGSNLYKIDAVSGTVVASGEMVDTSSFAINTPTFGDGMIFVGLQGGRVQAFDARTLESLWVYTDPLGKLDGKSSQPNCPITYYNGYVYTGFWRGETDQANFVCLSATDEDPNSGDETKLPTWVYTTNGGYYWAGAYVCDNYLLVGTDDGDSGCTASTGRLLCLDPATGKLLGEIDNLQGDVRSSVAREGDTFYFTTKGGYFYAVTVDGAYQPKISWSVKLENGSNGTAMSTSTPVVYKGRAYVGVCGTGQFSNYSGHNITVIDLESKRIAYRVATRGYPQTSGLLTAGYDDGYAYVYFIDNATPGKLRVLKDKPGQGSALLIDRETYSQQGKNITVDTAYALFTPSGEQAQFAICSPIADQYGTLYFKNDSGYLMALTSAVEKVETTTSGRTEYAAGETFDPTGMELTVTYANGMTRKLPARQALGSATIAHAKWQTEPLTKENGEGQGFSVSYCHVKYYSDDNGKKVEAAAPESYLPLTIKPPKGDVTGDYVTDVYDLQRLYEHCNGINEFKGSELEDAGLADGEAVTQMQNLYSFLTAGEWENTEDSHTITVKNGAPSAATVKQGKTYRLRLSDVFNSCSDAAYTLSKNGCGQETKLAEDDAGWYLTFTESGVDQYTLVITAVCGQTRVDHTLTITVEQDNGDEQEYRYDETDQKRVTVYVTISNNGIPLVGKDGTVLAHLKVDVPYFDLEKQGLSAYYRYPTAGGVNGEYVSGAVIKRPTVLHLYLYLLGVYCQGYTPEQVTSGEKKLLEDICGSDAYQSMMPDSDGAYLWSASRALLVPTGSATSMYMQSFWGHNENLMYFRNHKYPYMRANYGATADYILLSDNDTIDLAMFSDTTFHDRGAFACFDKDVYSASAGKELTFTTRKHDTRSVSDGGSGGITDITGLTVLVYDETWNLVDGLEGDGSKYTYTFENPGTYYLMAIESGAGEATACVAPATARVTVS